jgi:hypothetical protein
VTNIYVRVQRQGSWQNLEIDQLTDDELGDFFAEQTPHKCAKWAATLAAWIRDHVRESEP